LPGHPDHGGIAERKVGLVVEQETSPKDSIERLRQPVLQDKTGCTQASFPRASAWPWAQSQKTWTPDDLLRWHNPGWHQSNPAKPRYVFRSTDNGCEAVTGSLLAMKW
jgi:branched-chain amino acid transport system substrate-binding protein